MKKLINLFSLLAIVLFASSCGSTKNKEVAERNSINISGNWSLKYLGNEEASTLFEGQLPSVQIDQTNNTMSGIAGCNTFSGQFTFKKGTLSAPNLITTMMLCDHKNAEPQFLQAITGDSQVYLQDGMLVFAKNGQVVAKFEKGIDNALLSGEWILETLNGQRVKGLFAENIPTLIFTTADQNISGMGGCNTYNANYKLEGFTFKVGPVRTTRMACPYSANETKYIQGISDISTMALDGDTLTLTKGPNEELKFVKKTVAPL